MAIRIIREDEPLGVDTLVVVLYGEPGIGKTSLAFTSEHPLLEDYDDGLKRSVGRKTAVKFDKWTDASEFHKSKDFTDLAPKTLIFDTAGTLLDNFMALYVGTVDPKNIRGGGELALQGYGALKNLFKQFVAEMKARKINLIFIAHTESFKDGDTVKFRPKMTGGSYDILLAEADMVGYMESRANKRTISFSPTDRTIGKNTAEFGVIEVPHYTAPEYHDFMAQLIEKTKEKMLTINEAQQEAITKVAAYRETIQNTTEIDEMIPLHGVIEELSPVYKLQLLALFEPNFMKLWDVELVKVTNAKQAQLTLSRINTVPKPYLGKLQRKLWERCQPIGIGFDKVLNVFTDPENTSAPETGKDAKKAAGKAPTAAVANGSLPLE